MKDFLGDTFVPDRDRSRLSIQQHRVEAVMADGQYHTLAELEDRLGHPQASISARLRSMRQPAHGGHTIERRYVKRGLFEYRMIRKEQP